MDVQDIYVGQRCYYACFFGSDAVQFLIKNGHCYSIHEAEELGNRLLSIERIHAHSLLGSDHFQNNVQAVIALIDDVSGVDSTRESIINAEVEAVLESCINQICGEVNSFGNHYGIFSIHPRYGVKPLHPSLERAKTEYRTRRDTIDEMRKMKIARIATWIVHPYFNAIALGTIVLSCGLAGMQNDTFPLLVLWGEGLCTLIFTAEVLFRVIAQGFLWTGNNAYLRNGWNCLDLCVTLSTLISFSLSLYSWLTMGKISTDIRFLQALIPLRIIHYNDGIKVVVSAILQTIPCLVNILLVLLLFVFMFAIIAVNLFAGKFTYCQGDSTDFYARGIDTCITEGNITSTWINPINNYDTIPSAMLSLLQLTTLQGWTSVMYEAMDTPTIVMLQYTTIHQEMLLSSCEGTILLTQEQKRWISIQKQIFTKRPSCTPRNIHTNLIQRYAFTIAIHSVFKTLELIAVGLNIVLLALWHFPSSNTFNSMYNSLELAFLVYFMFEAIVKLLAFGPSYFSSSTKLLDIILLAFTLSEVFYDSGVGHIASLLRIYRFLEKYDGLMSLLKMLETCLPSLINVAALLVLVLFVFALLGMNIFTEKIQGDCIHDERNFDTLLSSMLILFVLVTVCISI
ncbi:sodium channel protein type 11 subunit alpha [Thraustotheca clavata]|uniref:Sodium channel protein type 11 subunit alpha n=1 Tax=Thraustotheca clavata TaxID=74557 RepID=A0A1V9YR19_9STRA|nr:sodium channel protein type 11 subunit alpha [Thraustotheca clavata]